MRRSLLFIPANTPGMLQSANIFATDSVIFDLEDAVSVDQKDAARSLLKNFLNTFTLEKEVIVRINSIDTKYFIEDIKEIVSDKIDAVMLPKANVDSILKLVEFLKTEELVKKMTKKILIIPIIEEALSVLQVEEIVKLDRVNGLLLGAEDLTNNLEIERTKQGDEILYPRYKIAYACKAYNIDAIDTPFTDVNDMDGLKADCLKAKAIGLTAKAAIHPNQIEIINESFSPTKQQIDYAKKVILAASNTTEGVFSLDGKMVDKPIIERSKKILEKARKYDLL